MLNDLIRPDHVVVDFGAGRGRQATFGGPHMQAMTQFKGRCAKVIGLDVDPAVLENTTIDEGRLITPGKPLPLEDASVDVLFAYAVFEHVEDPKALAAELKRVVKPGGWICGWTPNRWSYYALGAQLFPSRMHAKLLSVIAPNTRKAEDVFPTHYRMNTLGAIRKLFPKDVFENLSFPFQAQPSYNFGSTLIARQWMIYMALTPSILSHSLFVFLRHRLG